MDDDQPQINVDDDPQPQHVNVDDPQKDNIVPTTDQEIKGSLYERGKQFLTIKESKLNKERARKVNQGSSECTFQPNISKKSKNMTREESLYEYNNKWKTKVDHNIEELRAKQLKREEEQIHSKPSPLSVVSQFIIQKKQEQKEYTGPITGWEKRFDEYRNKNVLYFEEEYNFSPRINEKSTQLASKHRSEVDSNPFERLYGDSKKKKDDDTLSSPKDKKKFSDYEEDRKRAEVEFYKKSIERQQEAEKKKAKMKEDQEDQYSFKPIINKHSKDIAKHMERAPLYSPKKGSSSPPSTHTSATTNESFITIKPDSTSPTKKKFEVDNFIQRRLAKEKQRQDKINQLKHDIIEEEMKECTFKPIINQKSVELAHLWVESFDNDLEELYEFDPRYSQSTPKPFLKKNSSPGLSSSNKKEKLTPTKPSPVRQSLKSSSSNIIESIIDDAMKSIEMERSLKSTPMKINLEVPKESTKKEIVTPKINSESNRTRYPLSDDDDEDFVSIENEMKSAIQEFEDEWSKFESL